MSSASAAASSPRQRDEFIDFMRGFSLVIVVVWHWVFTIIVWTPRGPSPTSPLGYTRGMWFITWFFQVLPLFFFVGGYAHRMVWAKVRLSGGGYWQFVSGRMRRLLIPCLSLLVTWILIGVVVVAFFNVNAQWMRGAVLLIVSPLWFIAVYLVLVLIAPIMLGLHKRFGPVVIVVMAGLVALVDVGRFAHDVNSVSLVNLVLVWGLCHQLGFFYGPLVEADRIWYWTMALGGGFALTGLVLTRIYPLSMVGVPGDRISNMSPPTLCIVALCFFQVGIALLLRPWILRKLAEPKWAERNDVINRFALPLFLFHTTGYAIAFAILYAFGYRAPAQPTMDWWLQRPAFLLLPMLCTLPVIFIFGRKWITPKPTPVPAPETLGPTGEPVSAEEADRRLREAEAGTGEPILLGQDQVW